MRHRYRQTERHSDSRKVLNTDTDIQKDTETAITYCRNADTDKEEQRDTETVTKVLSKHRHR